MSDPSSTRDIATGDVVVIGGGVMGLASALALAERGLRVTLVDRAPGPAAEASGAAAGIISLLYPWDYPESVQALARLSRERYPFWYPKFTVPGLLSFDAAPDGVGERLDRAAIAQRAPNISPPHDSAVWLKEVGAVEPRYLAAALAARADDAGVKLRWGSEVASLSAGDGRVDGVVLVNGTRLTARHVLVATGAWSADLIAPLGVRVPVYPVRGQVVEFTGAHGLLNTIVTAGHRYLLPRGDGRLLAGSTVEDTGFDASVTDAAGDDLRAFAIRLLPATEGLALARHWAGLRPATADGVPLIGRVRGIDGLWLNTGHFRNGITLAPGSADLVAAMLTGEPPPLDPTPFERL